MFTHRLGASWTVTWHARSFQHEALNHCLETQVLQVRTSKELFDGIRMVINLVILVVLGSSALVSPS